MVTMKRLPNEFRKIKLDNAAIQIQKSKQITRISVAILATLGFLLSVCSQSFANDYLDALTTEAKSTAAVTTKSQLSSTEKKQLKEMEDLLKTKKPSTYKYYAKLNKIKKERAFKAYANDQSRSKQRLHNLQTKVMDLYFAQ